MWHIRRGILTNTVDRPRYLVRHEQSYRLVQGATLTPPEVGAEVPDTKKRCPAGNTDKRIEQRRCKATPADRMEQFGRGQSRGVKRE